MDVLFVHGALVRDGGRGLTGKSPRAPHGASSSKIGLVALILDLRWFVVRHARRLPP